MKAAGMAATIDAVGNVVGRYESDRAGAKTLILGSHYDTVLNAGKYDGRLGILTALVAIEELHRTNRRLPFHVDVIAFSEEEGVRFAAPYIGSSAVAGRFDMNLLPRRDAGGVGLGDALEAAGFDPHAIPQAARKPEDLIGYLEVHIEQGPILLQESLPLGIVTSIAGAARFVVTVTGEAGHAGTVPMALRHDAAAAAAEIVLSVERHAQGAPSLVGTVGRLQVPNGATNVIPGRVEMSMEMRAETDAIRDGALAAVMADITEIAQRRGVTIDVKETVRTPAVPCAPRLQKSFADAITRAGLTPRFLTSGAGHDAVMLSNVTDVGMLFVRCGNGGISHSPREIITAEDADIGARVLLDVLLNFGTDHGTH
jgi:allantoate deiminase/N-carbamoyl-L-amino-acid hydrolase